MSRRSWDKVPVIRFGHRGNPNHMVIGSCNWMIVISEMGQRLCLQRYDLEKVSIHSQSSRSNRNPALTPCITPIASTTNTRCWYNCNVLQAVLPETKENLWHVSSLSLYSLLPSHS